MQINKKFWYKDNGPFKQAYSYDDQSYVKKFSSRYGGEALDYLEVNEEIASLIDVETEVYSVLVNSKAEEPKELPRINDPRRFEVLVSNGEGFKKYDEGHQHLRDANNAAKSITKYYKTVVVVRKRYVERTENNVCL